MPHFATPELKFLRKLLLVSSFFAASYLAPACAQQAQTFSTYQRGGAQEFTYIYPTTGAPQTLNIRLNLADIARGSAEFTRWNEADARASAIAATEAAAQKLGSPELTFTVNAIPGGMSIRAQGTDRRLRDPGFMKQVEAELREAYRSAERSYARTHYYRMVPQGENAVAIMPNHPAIAQRYTAAMGPVAEALRSQVPGAARSPRAFIDAALNWLQTIPYDTLENRTTSNGAGFQTPYGLMLGNLGDCDTKATALAALIRAAYPSLPLAIVYVPDHAFLAIGLPQENNDYALRTSHGTYILADATGPGLTPLGFIDAPTRAKIRNANARTEVLPIP